MIWDHSELTNWARPVPPKDEIYKFITFQASEIKDINVVEYAYIDNSDAVTMTPNDDEDENDGDAEKLK